MTTREELERQLIASFLDDVAEYFDREESISPESIFTDPCDGNHHITARGLLELIRLGKTEEQIFCPVCNKSTKHSTGWESERPNVTYRQCTVCRYYVRLACN